MRKTGQPVAKARVTARGFAVGSGKTTSGANGRFSLWLPSPATNHGDKRYQLTVSARGFFAWSQTATLGSGAVSATLAPDFGRLQGSVVTSRGKPAIGVPIRITSRATGNSVRLASSRRRNLPYDSPAADIHVDRSIHRYRRIRSGEPRVLDIAPGTGARISVRLPRSRGAVNGWPLPTRQSPAFTLRVPHSIARYGGM